MLWILCCAFDIVDFHLHLAFNFLGALGNMPSLSFLCRRRSESSTITLKLIELSLHRPACSRGWQLLTSVTFCKSTTGLYLIPFCCLWQVCHGLQNRLKSLSCRQQNRLKRDKMGGRPKFSVKGWNKLHLTEWGPENCFIQVWSQWWMIIMGLHYTIA